MFINQGFTLDLTPYTGSSTPTVHPRQIKGSGVCFRFYVLEFRVEGRNIANDLGLEFRALGFRV